MPEWLDRAYRAAPGGRSAGSGAAAGRGGQGRDPVRGAAAEPAHAHIAGGCAVRLSAPGAWLSLTARGLLRIRAMTLPDPGLDRQDAGPAHVQDEVPATERNQDPGRTAVTHTLSVDQSR